MSRVPVRRRCPTPVSAGLALALACGLMLWGSSMASAASSSHRRQNASSAQGLSSTPPIPLGRTAGPRSSTVPASHRSANSPTAAASATRLPATGYDAAAAAGLGIVLLTAGLGLRRLTGGRRT